MQRRLKGFTLVEVLIVIIIIGILIAALLPRLVGAQARARDNARAAMVNQIANGVALLLNDAGTIYSTTGTMCMSTLTGLTGTVNSVTTSLTGYLASLPKDPQSNHGNNPYGATCNGSAWMYGGSNAGTSFAFVYADFEGTNGANTAAPASTDDTADEFQTLLVAGGTAGFGVLVR